MGVCGYTYDQVSAMPMNATARAISARKKFVGEILRAAFGVPDEAPSEAVSIRPLTEVFDAVFQ